MRRLMKRRAKQLSGSGRVAATSGDWHSKQSSGRKASKQASHWTLVFRLLILLVRLVLRPRPASGTQSFQRCDSSLVLSIGTGDLIRVMRSAADRTCIPALDIGNTGTLDHIPPHDSNGFPQGMSGSAQQAESSGRKRAHGWLHGWLACRHPSQGAGHLDRDTVMVCLGHSLLEQVTSNSSDKRFIGKSVTMDTATTPEHATEIKRLHHSATLNPTILHKLL